MLERRIRQDAVQLDPRAHEIVASGAVHARLEDAEVAERAAGGSPCVQRPRRDGHRLIDQAGVAGGLRPGLSVRVKVDVKTQVAGPRFAEAFTPPAREVAEQAASPRP